MGILDSIKSALSPSKKAASSGSYQWPTSPTLSIFALGGRSRSSAALRAAYRGWAAACIGAKMEEVGNIEFKLYQLGKDGEVADEVMNGDIIDLLYKVNPTTTKYECFSMISAHLDIFGRAYLWITKDGNKRQLNIAQPDRVQQVFDEKGTTLLGYVYHENDSSGRDIEHKILPEDMIPFREADPFNPRQTYSIMESAYEWIETDIYASEWNKMFFKNNAVPSKYLKTEQPLAPDQEKRLMESMMERYKGIDRAHTLGILPPRTSIENGSSEHKDMEFSTLDERFRDKILAAFKTPKTVLGIVEDVNRANAEATNYVYSLRVIKPRMERICETLDEYLIPLFGENLWLTCVDPVSPDADKERAKITTALGNQPYMSVNEIRESEGLPPIQGGDAVMSNFSLVTVGEPKKTATREPAKTREKPRSPARKAHAPIQTTHEDAKTALIAALTKAAKDAEDPEEIAHKHFVSRNSPYVGLLAQRMRTVNDRFRKAYNAKLPEMIDSAGKDLATDDKEAVGVVFKAAHPIMTEIFTDEASHFFTAMSLGEFEVTPAMRQLIADKTDLLAASYTNTMREGVASSIERGLAEGMTPNQIRDLVNELVFDFADEVRADMVADTEVFRMANIGLSEAYRASGIVKTVKWYTANDERVCEFCAPLHGTVIDVKKDFFKVGDVYIGAEGGKLEISYDDIRGGSLHPRCRCYIDPQEISIAD